MEHKVLICALVMFFGHSWTSAADQPAFSDIWSNELHESYATCRGRLPNPDESALQLMKGAKSWYAKYMDQISLFRLISILAGGQGERPLGESRCLFESPCFTQKINVVEENYINATFTVCTGAQLGLTQRFTPDGLVEITIFQQSGAVAVTGIYSPTLTDGKTFILYISCLPDGSAGFQVFTTRPALSAYARHIIKEHLENSGFKDNFRISTPYMSTSCKHITAKM